MNIIEMIIVTLIGILLTNAVAWLMIYRQGNQIKEILKDEIEAGRVVRGVKFVDEDA